MQASDDVIYRLQTKILITYMIGIYQSFWRESSKRDSADGLKRRWGLEAKYNSVLEITDYLLMVSYTYRTRM